MELPQSPEPPPVEQEIAAEVPPPDGSALYTATMLKDVTINTEKYLAGQTYSVTRGVLETLRSLGAVS